MQGHHLPSVLRHYILTSYVSATRKYSAKARNPKNSKKEILKKNLEDYKVF